MYELDPKSPTSPPPPRSVPEAGRQAVGHPAAPHRTHRRRRRRCVLWGFERQTAIGTANPHPPLRYHIAPKYVAPTGRVVWTSVCVSVSTEVILILKVARKRRTRPRRIPPHRAVPSSPWLPAPQGGRRPRRPPPQVRAWPMGVQRNSWIPLSRNPVRICIHGSG